MTAKEEAVYLAYSQQGGVLCVDFPKRRLIGASTAQLIVCGVDVVRCVAQLEKNLGRRYRRCLYSDLRKMSRQSMRKCYWCDAFRMPDWSNKRIVNTFDCVGEYRLQRGLAENRASLLLWHTWATGITLKRVGDIDPGTIDCRRRNWNPSVYSSGLLSIANRSACRSIRSVRRT